MEDRRIPFLLVREVWLFNLIVSCQLLAGRMPGNPRKEILEECFARLAPPTTALEQALWTLCRRQAVQALDRSMRGAAVSVPNRAAALLILLETEYQTQVSLGGLCKLFACNKTTLEHEFKRAFGQSIHKRLTEIRLAHAKQSLLCTDMKVEAIVIEVGYRSKTAFYRAFIAENNISPAAFRRVNRATTFEQPHSD
jgi:transcriptional regulator GlxA family with amidase domain